MGEPYIVLLVVLLVYLLWCYFSSDGIELNKNDIYQNEVIDAYNSIDEGDTKDSVQNKLGHLTGINTYLFEGVKNYNNREVYCYRWLCNWYPNIKNAPQAYILVYFDMNHNYVDKDHFALNSSRFHVIEG